MGVRMETRAFICLAATSRRRGHRHLTEANAACLVWRRPDPGVCGGEGVGAAQCAHGGVAHSHTALTCTVRYKAGDDVYSYDYSITDKLRLM